MRHYRREYGSYTKNDLIHSVRMAGWLFERIRVEGPALSLQHLECMQDHLLLKLAVVELALTEIVSCPAPTDRCST
jgi:hypothetical protein